MSNWMMHSYIAAQFNKQNSASGTRVGDLYLMNQHFQAEKEQRKKDKTKKSSSSENPSLAMKMSFSKFFEKGKFF